MKTQATEIELVNIPGVKFLVEYYYYNGWKEPIGTPFYKQAEVTIKSFFYKPSHSMWPNPIDAGFLLLSDEILEEVNEFLLNLHE